MSRGEPSGSPRLLAALSHKVLQHVGIDFSGPRRGDLLRRLQLLALERQITDFDSWVQQLAFADWDAAQVQSLIAAFTVGETYFRRDAEAFDWLARHHLAPLMARRRQEGRRHLRLWSAGCCTGEEAYGLLFLIDELLGGESADWSVELVASDINGAFLARAEQGIYGRNAFRSSEEDFRRRYFQAEGPQWRVRPAWRQRIRFVQYNLADGCLPPALADADLILCRNVLMYFSTGRALAAVRRLLGSLSADGILLLSAVEASLATQAGLVGSWAGCNYALAPAARQDVRVSSPAPSRAFAAEQVALGKARPLYPKQTSGEARQPAPATSPAPAEQAADASADAIRERRWQQVARAQASGQHEQVREALQAYLSCPGLSRSQQHQACLAMAQSWADQQRPEPAQEWLQRALALDSNSPKLYWLQALLAQQSGDLRLAQAALQKALYLDPEFILGYFLRARLLRAEGQARAGEKALQVCRQLLLVQDVASLVPQGDGLSCVQLLRLCDQLLEEPSGCPSH